MCLLYTVPEVSFYFVRHGETLGNERNLCQGHIDFPLTAKGEAQAGEAARALKSLGIRRIATSPLGRTRRTSQIIAEALGVTDITEYPNLIERGWGELEGEHNSLMFAQEELERSPSWDGSYTIKGMETKEELLRRIATAMSEVLTEPSPVAIVGHGRFFNALCELLHVDPIKQIANGVPLGCTPRGAGSGWEIVPIQETL
jgi:broad specificity phosphatase PhoE